MAATTDSKAVFKARCEQLGLDDANVTALTVTTGYDTYSNFAYSCAYQPYSGDEAPFIAMLVHVCGAQPDARVTSIYRRLFSEAHALCLQDMRARIDRSDDNHPHRLLAAERSSRYEEQRGRLNGLELTGPLECSNSLVDAVFQQFDDNCLRWIPLESLTSREQEMLGQRKDPELVEYAANIQAGKNGHASCQE